jgi:hypothetical protein
MSNKNTEPKAYLSVVPAALVFTIVLLLSLLAIVLTGCDRIIQSEPHFDLVIPPTELESCGCCGFVPWTDSWCEFHMGA